MKTARFTIEPKIHSLPVNWKLNLPLANSLPPSRWVTSSHPLSLFLIVFALIYSQPPALALSFNRLRSFGLNARPLGGAVIPEPLERTGTTTDPAPMRNNLFRFVPVPEEMVHLLADDTCKTASEEGAGPHAGARAIPSGSCSHRRAIHGVALFGLCVPAFPAPVLEHFRPVVKWVSRWVSPGGWAGAAETQGCGLEET